MVISNLERKYVFKIPFVGEIYQFKDYSYSIRPGTQENHLLRNNIKNVGMHVQLNDIP